MVGWPLLARGLPVTGSSGLYKLTIWKPGVGMPMAMLMDLTVISRTEPWLGACTTSQ